MVGINTPKGGDEREHKRAIGAFLNEAIKLESNDTVTLQNTFHQSQSLSGALSPQNSIY